MSLILAAAIVHPQTKDASSLNEALKRMESVGRTFKTFQARFSQKSFTAVLNEFDTPESGEFFYALASDGSALIREEFQKPGLRILTIKGGTATLYQPSVNQAQIVNLGKNKNKAEYLAIGIGQSPAKLQQNFDIQYQGSESVNGFPCWVLLLKPKTAGVASMFSAITLWVKMSNGIPIQDKLLQSSGDYTLITFINEQLNKSIAPSKFEQKLPPGVEKQVIQ
jgi:outer membrane lipoprotein-sorting protein